ncbi:MAG: extracellular solute-binding protein [Spirochaetaceae bacterium]|nr:MAG: extracellular solute-binding protein [Spirochaetaceae bacterium]
MKRKYFASVVVLLLLATTYVWSTGTQEAEKEAEKITVNLLSHRFPALEFFAQALEEEAPPNVKVVGDLMPYDKYYEKAKITFAAGSSAYDIVWVNAGGMADFAAKGWILPLDDFVKKYNAKYDLSDIPPQGWDSATYNGKISEFPLYLNTMLYFYREDIFKAAGISPAETLDDYLMLAKKLTTAERYGTSMTLRRVDFLRNDFHSWLSAFGGSWFDKGYKPIFNGTEGIKAVEYMLKLKEFAPPGVLTYGNDESTVAMQQDRAAMMLQWASRCAPMDNAELSKVVNKVQWKPGPSLKPGGIPAARLAIGDGYAISAFTKQNPEIIFDLIARVGDYETMKRGAHLFFPARVSLSTDSELMGKYRWYPAVGESLDRGVLPMPVFGAYEEACEFITKRIAQALNNELGVKEALDLAAKETEEFLKERGYY